jgi:ABC-2 type transport system ATP-binding protein
MSSGLRATHLGFRFAGGAGIDDVTLHAAPGRIVGFLGRNGAGKTTTMRVLAGILAAQQGQATLNGVDVHLWSARRSIGYAPEEPALLSSLTVREHLEDAARLADRGRTIDDVVAALDLAAVVDRLAGVLSKGTRQRVGTAMALLGTPQALILDEPTAGLDPAQVLALRDVLREARDRGCAVLLSSHVVTEVSAIADDVVAITGGRTVHEGTIETLEAAVNAAIGAP